MTKEEAIEVLLKVRPCIIDNAQEDALDLAIEALPIERANGTSEIPKDLEEAADKYLDKLFGKGKHQPFYKELFIAGAKLQKEQDDRLVDIIYQQGIEKGKDDMKEQMLKETVKGEVFFNPYPTISLDDCEDYDFKDDDKVRVIVIPNTDEK